MPPPILRNLPTQILNISPVSCTRIVFIPLGLSRQCLLQPIRPLRRFSSRPSRPTQETKMPRPSHDSSINENPAQRPSAKDIETLLSSEDSQTSSASSKEKGQSLLSSEDDDSQDLESQPRFDDDMLSEEAGIVASILRDLGQGTLEEMNEDISTILDPSEQSNSLYSSSKSSLQSITPSSKQPSPSPSPPQLNPDTPTTVFMSPQLVSTHNYPPYFYPTRSTVSIHLKPKKPVSKHPLPSLPLPDTSHKDHRYIPLITQLTSLFIRDGKKARAQSQVQKILTILRSKGTPREGSNRGFALLPGCPPLHTLPAQPLEYLRVAVDSLAPLMRLKTVKASGGFTEQVPIPLNQKQRRRAAVMWILLAANTKKDRMDFTERIANEIVAVVEGNSSAWDKRLQVHRLAVAARANVKVN